MKSIFIMISTFAFLSMVQATDRPGGGNPTTDQPDRQLRVHREANIAFSVTNYGLIGSRGRGQIDPETGQPAPSAEFPGSSGIDYLFQGSLWIGAVVERENQPGIFDTLVSVGNDGWWGSTYELFPPAVGYPSMWRAETVGDEEYYAVYLDTNISEPNPDPNDGRVHRPIGIKVTQNSMCWSSAGFNEFFIINYFINNIYSRPLRDVWIGIYYDGDVYHISEPEYTPECGAQDDLCGYINHGEHGIAWIADNDGQPYDFDGTYQYTSISPTGVMALMLLGHSGTAIQTNFNWWISNINSYFDWGPMLLTNYNKLPGLFGGLNFPGGGLGTPGGDRAKYFVMSNGEHDYDQVYSNLPHSNWIPNTPQSSDIANGFDTRFLVSYGPMQIAAGETETLTVAYLGGNSFHTDPFNYMDNLEGFTNDSIRISQYYANINFSDLIAKADTVVSYYEHGFTQVPYGPPNHFRAISWNPHQIELSWHPKIHPQLREYRIYRGTSPGIYDPNPLTPPNFIDTVFTDSAILDNTNYYYAIASVKNSGVEGRYSAEVAVNSGQPHTPVGLTSISGSANVQLSWVAVPDSDIYSYLVYGGMQGDTLALIDTSNAISYTAYGLINGITYNFAIRAIDHARNLSYFSDTISDRPMGFDSGILAVVGNRTGSYTPDYDSMTAFYNNILSGYHYTLTTTFPDSLNDLAPYSTIIWFKEDLRGWGFPYEASEYSDYLNEGGNLIVAGIKPFVPVGVIDTILYSSIFPSQYLGLSGAVYPDIHNSEFCGGQSISAEFPSFNLDTARVRRMNYPPFEHGDRLLAMGTLLPLDSSEVIYTYRSVFPETSIFEGQPIAVINRTGTYNTAVLEMPLYYIQEPASFEILHSILSMVGETTDINEESVQLPKQTTLIQNCPNPFNPATTIKYSLSQNELINVSIYNILGQKVATLYDGIQSSGNHSLEWNSGDFPTGVYFAQLKATSGVSNIKMLLLK